MTIIDSQPRLNPFPREPASGRGPRHYPAPQPDLDTSWKAGAACKGSLHLFFIGLDNPRPAIQICNACPVRVECLDYALANGEAFGIWGGMTERGRLREKRRRALLKREG